MNENENDPKKILSEVLQDLAERDGRVLPNGLLNQVQHDFNQAWEGVSA